MGIFQAQPSPDRQSTPRHRMNALGALAARAVSRPIYPTVAKSNALAAGTALALLLGGAVAVEAADLKPPAPAAAGPYDWTGFTFGGHLGYAFASSNFQTPDAAGSVSLQQKLNTFNEAGGFVGGLHAGYNYMLPNRVVLGVEADGTFPAFPNLNGFGVGGQTQFVSPALGSQTYSDNVLASGTVRGRIGYAPGNWLVYATGGFAWSRDQLGIVQQATGLVDYPVVSRVGWTVGGGVEAAIAPHWTGRLEYLYSQFGSTGAQFPFTGQRITSDLRESQLRAGVTYHFGEGGPGTAVHDALGFLPAIPAGLPFGLPLGPAKGASDGPDRSRKWRRATPRSARPTRATTA